MSDLPPFSIHLTRGTEHIEVIFAKEPKTPRAARNTRRRLDDIMESGGVNSVKMWAADRPGVSVRES